MHRNQPNEGQNVCLFHKPVTNTLLQYLTRIDLIELSKCCKLYRNKLEKNVLEKLDLHTWDHNNHEIYIKLKVNRKVEEILSYLETDLGSKLKIVKKFELFLEINSEFAKKFIRLLPNIKELIISIGLVEFNRLLDLKTILNGLAYLESVQFNDTWFIVYNNSTKNHIFPKSIKSLKIKKGLDSFSVNSKSLIYDTIDTSYVNLYSLTIVSSRMLKNLSSGMQSLQEVEIRVNDSDDQSNLVEFLIANSQLKKLSIDFIHYDEQIVKTILSFKYLERWCIDSELWEEIELDNIPVNLSIKYLKISNHMPAPLTLQLISSCNSLRTLEFVNYKEFQYLDWSKLNRRIHILKLTATHYTLSTIEEIESWEIFNILNYNESYCIADYSAIEVDWDDAEFF